MNLELKLNKITENYIHVPRAKVSMYPELKLNEITENYIHVLRAKVKSDFQNFTHVLS